ncbi:asparaginase [Streptomyces sp. NBRC 109706]|uniref:asparaginase n=1 Tax=Streptomyces sp. NBRC 109706 TaxID=1550035 RepID=UPI0007844CDE|nr:asparaginase [Streptomyces sp. NBRC 109706]
MARYTTPPARPRPQIAVITLGGTIASRPGGGPPGAVPELTGADLIAAAPGIESIATLTTHAFRQLPSSELTVPDICALARAVDAHAAAGSARVVVTQGTDTMEETAFVLDLLRTAPVPVVVTGAMRNAAQPGADGPANLITAIRAAAEPAVAELGVVVAMNDELHAARQVTKAHTTSPAAFRSPGSGPLGWISESEVRLTSAPRRAHRLPNPLTGEPETMDPPPVALLTGTLGDDGRLIAAATGAGYAGLVIEALGGGHLPSGALEAVTRAASLIPVVLASRTGAGAVLAHSYGFPGAEIDLRSRGLLTAGDLSGPKARLLLLLLLALDLPRPQLEDQFARIARG